MTYFWIAIGSALGGVSRFACGRVVGSWLGESFPWGTLAVNIAGSFVIGFFATLSGSDGRVMVSPDMRQFVTVGFCGGFTTFSAFSWQTLELLRDNELAEAAGNVLLSVGLCMLAVWLGSVAAATLNGLKPGT
jgi:CrcB protein